MLNWFVTLSPRCPMTNCNSCFGTRKATNHLFTRKFCSPNCCQMTNDLLLQFTTSLEKNRFLFRSSRETQARRKYFLSSMKFWSRPKTGHESRLRFDNVVGVEQNFAGTMARSPPFSLLCLLPFFSQRARTWYLRSPYIRRGMPKPSEILPFFPSSSFCTPFLFCGVGNKALSWMTILFSKNLRS